MFQTFPKEVGVGKTTLLVKSKYIVGVNVYTIPLLYEVTLCYVCILATNI